MELLRTLAPFALAVLLLVDKVGGRDGEQWFLKSARQDLESLGAKNPDAYATTFWQKAQVAKRPGALYNRILATSLGIYLLLPDQYLDAGAIVLFAIAVGAVWIVGKIAPPAKENAGPSGRSRAGVATLALVLLIAGCAVAKAIF